MPTQAVFFETPSNPMQSLVDIAAVSELAHAAGAKVVLDNVFATPLLQQGIPLGADVVVYSGTKHIDGQGRVLGGAILGDKEYIDGPVQKLMRHTGPALSAVQRLDVAQGSWRRCAVRVELLGTARRTGSPSSCEQQAARELGANSPFLESHPQYDLAKRQMRRRGQRWSPSSSMAAARTVPSRCSTSCEHHRHLQQPRRRQVADHPPGHHHPPGDGAGRAGRRSGWVTAWCGSRSALEGIEDLTRRSGPGR